MRKAAPGQISLPYRFDTSYVGTLVLKAAAWLEAVLLVGMVVKLFAGDMRTAAGILFLFMFIGGFAVMIFRRAGGSVGTITATDVTVEPVTLYGFTTTSPGGRFPIAGFKSIRLEWRPRIPEPGVQMSAGIDEYIYLSGKEGTPDIEIGRIHDGSGRAFARELGERLSLPVEERPAPGVHGRRD